MYFLAIPAFIGLGTGIIMILPYATKWINGMDEPYIVGMVNENLPFPCWYPFPTHEGVTHWVVVLLQCGAAGSLAFIALTLLLMLLENSQRIKYEYRVLGYSLEIILKRSMKLYLQMNPWKKSASVNVQEPEFQRMIELCLIDSVIHHHKILEYVSLFGQQVSLLGFLTYSVGTGVIALSLFNIIDAINSEDISSIILFSIFIISEVLVQFAFCVLGEAITSESVALRNKLYCSKWHYFDRRNRKIVLNFHTAMTEPVVITAMGLINVSLETFATIMNSSYSFFNIVNST
uniref:Olfactory receptor 23 n=1 Tax=Adelphocoris lineolatus TaxID=236346 RepID=A0A2I4PH23_ADELI|nr:olfactory receptor 23 [Adelphocoris lineolatus]